LSKKAIKQFKALPKLVRERARAKIDSLATNPRPNECKALKGAKGLFRVRVGDYRVIYSIADKELLILVVEIGNRREIYKEK
jgi:mRNA interferase RelE/StbE